MDKMDQKIIMRKVEELIPYARNAKKHPDEQITKISASIKEFGWTNPILTDGENGILAGHGRLAAAKKLGLTEVPTIDLAHLNKSQRKAYILMDNRSAQSDWDNDLLTLELGELKELNFDLELTGFDVDELSLLFPDEIPEGLTDPDDVPDVPEDPVTKLGDIWLLGNHRLMCGDSTSIDAVEKLMEGKHANMLHTDPPYGVNYEGVPNDHLKDSQLEQFLVDALTNANTVLHPGSNVYVWHADITALEFISAFRKSGFRQARPPTIQWVKPSLTMSQGDYHSQNEPCLFGWKEGAGRVRVKDRKQTTIWHCDRTTDAKVHPTMKPVELCQRAIENSSVPNCLVLDLFGGSGSTLIACEKTNRYSRLMELDPKYCDVIITRWQNFTDKQATLESTGQTFEEVKLG